MEIRPQPEICNSMDDDCNGPVDDIPRAEYIEDNYADLLARHAACTGSDDPNWLGCNFAIQTFCDAQACRTSGYGFAELDASTGTLVCLSEAPTREVTATQLASFGTCPSPGVTQLPVSARFSCQQAIHGYCKQNGFVSGFGPVGSASATSWTIVCLGSGRATEVATTYAAIAAVFAGCNSPSAPAAYPGACLAGAKRFCQANSHYSGFGPVVNGSGQNTTVICVDP